MSHHHHGHHHAPAAHTPAHRRRLAWAFGITAGIVVIQLVGAVLTGSLALFTDTVHAVTDSAGLLVALIASTLALRPATTRRTWGFRRVEVLAALAQAVLLLAVGVYTAVEGIRRLWSPPEVPGAELLLFGVLGLAANVVAIAILASSRDANFNLRAAFLEVVNDALGSLGVVIAGVVIMTTGFTRADAIAALLIAALIVPRAAIILRETVAVLLEFTPPDLDLEEVRRHILALEHVKEVHDLHASTVATGLPTLSAHVVVEEECFHDGHAPDILSDLRHCVAEHFAVSVQHTTFQLETERFAEAEPDCSAHA